METYRLLQFYTLALVLVALTNNVCAAEDKLLHSAYFRHENTVHVTQQSWVISFKLDFTPYREGYDGLAAVYTQLAHHHEQLRGVQVYENDTDTVSVKVYQALQQQQDEELADLWSLMGEISRSVQRLGPLVTRLATWNTERNKRALLPFVGNILGALFGTATSSDVREIKRYLNVLADSDTQIRHVLQKTITVLNHTYMGTIGNRQAINDLIEVNDGLNRRVSTLSGEIKGLLLSFKHFALRYLQIQQQTSMIYRSATQFLAKLDKFKFMIDAAIGGSVSQDMIPPPVLRMILRDVRGHLKANLEIPFPPNEPLEQYYKLLKSSVVPLEDGLLVFTTIPLRDTISEFDVYAIQSIPIPYQDSNIVTSYQFMEKFMAISLDRTKVTFLNEIEMTICTHETLQFCPIKSPVYKIAALSNNCVLALFLERDNIWELCTAVVTTASTPTPSAISIGQGQWVISTKTPLTFTKVCEPSGIPTRVTVQPPMGLVSLGEGCQASSEFIILPSEVSLKSSYQLDRVNFSIPKLMKIWNPVDTLMNQSMIKIPHKLKKIVSVQPSMDSLMQQLQQELPLMEMPMSPWEIASIVLSVCGGIICIIIGVYCWYHKRFQRRIMERRSKGQCVRFAKDGNDASHSRAVAVLGGGGIYPRCNVGTTCNEKRDEYGGNAVRNHPNRVYEMVDLHDDDVTTFDGATGDISERDGTKQKKPSISPLHDAQYGQEMSVGCVVRDSRRNVEGN